MPIQNWKQQLSKLETELVPLLNSNYSFSFQTLAFLEAKKYADLVTGSGSNCVTSAQVWKFIQDCVTPNQEQN